MKKYKLLKDLPNIKAGTIFEYSSMNGLYLPKIADLKGWGLNDLLAFSEETIKSLPDWFEEVKECEHAGLKKAIREGGAIEMCPTKPAKYKCPECGKGISQEEFNDLRLSVEHPQIYTSEHMIAFADYYRRNFEKYVMDIDKALYDWINSDQSKNMEMLQQEIEVYFGREKIGELSKPAFKAFQETMEEGRVKKEETEEELKGHIFTKEEMVEWGIYLTHHIGRRFQSFAAEFANRYFVEWEKRRKKK